MTSVPSMRAFALPGAEQEPVEARVPIPIIAPDELLVKVMAVGVGIHDSYFVPQDICYPYPIGIEAAGVVEAVGGAISDHRAGDRIAFVSSMQPKGGTWAEYAAVRESSLIVPLPEAMSFEEAAAVPVAGNTVLRALRSLPPIAEGGSIFVAGASGAIGTFAVQLAAAKGWQVAASASQHNHDYLTSLGAAKTVDYHAPDWTEQVLEWMPAGVDAAIAVQPQTTADSIRVVRDGGTVLTISGDQVTPERGVQVVMPSHEVDVREELIALMDQIRAGQIRLVMEQIYPFADALNALAKVQTRHARGKLVLTMGVRS